MDLIFCVDSTCAQVQHSVRSNSQFYRINLANISGKSIQVNRTRITSPNVIPHTSGVRLTFCLGPRRSSMVNSIVFRGRIDSEYHAAQPFRDLLGIHYWLPSCSRTTWNLQTNLGNATYPTYPKGFIYPPTHTGSLDSVVWRGSIQNLRQPRPSEIGLPFTTEPTLSRPIAERVFHPISSSAPRRTSSTKLSRALSGRIHLPADTSPYQRFRCI